MDNETAAQFHRTYVVERIARLKLKIRRAEKPSWFSNDCVTWEENGEHESLDIPAGLDEEGAMRCVDIFQHGRERGMEEGREDMAGKIRDLLGVTKSE